MKIKHTKETSQKKKDSAASASGKNSSGTQPKQPRPPHKNEPWRNELLKCFGLKPDNVTPMADKTYWVAAANLATIHFPVEKIPDLYAWCDEQDWPDFTVMALAKRAGEWLADNDGESDDPYAWMFKPGSVIGGMPNGTS